MSVVVYPRLASLLQQRDLTPAELAHQIEARFGVTVSPESLDRLTQSTPVRHADLEIAGAAAAILGVGLDDVFTVAALPTEDDGAIDSSQAQRMVALMDRQNHHLLSAAEWAELDALVGNYGQRLHERNVRRLAQERGVSVEQMERELADRMAQARAWLAAFASDPRQDRLLAEQAAAIHARLPE